MDYGQIALGISRFTAPSAVGVAAGLTAEDSPGGEGGNVPSVRREPLFLHAAIKPPSLSPGPARPVSVRSRRARSAAPTGPAGGPGATGGSAQPCPSHRFAAGQALSGC